MVTIGTLEWSVQVKNAEEAKSKAQDVEEQVENASSSAEGADESVGGLSEKFKGLADRQEKVGNVTDRLNAKIGFLSTALMGALSSVFAFIGGMAALKAIIVGAGIAAALVVLGLAFKENFAGIRDRVSGFTDWLSNQFEASKRAVTQIWNSFTDGFKQGSGPGAVSNTEETISTALDGIQEALQIFWDFAGPIWTRFIQKVIDAAGRFGEGVGEIVTYTNKKLKPLFKEIGETAEALAPIVNRFLELTVPIFEEYLPYIYDLVDDIFSGIVIIVKGAIDIVISSIMFSLHLLQGDWKAAWNTMAGLVNRTFGRIISLIKTSISALSNVVMLVVKAIIAPFKFLYRAIVGNSIIPDLLNRISELFTGAVGMIKGAVGAVIGAILAPFKAIAGVASGAYKAIGGLVGGAMDAARSALSGAKSAISSAAGRVAGAITDAFEGAKSSVSGIVDGIGDMASDAVDSAKDAAGAAKDKGEGAIDKGKKAVGGAIKKGLDSLDSGGIVTSGGIAEIHKGEAVVPAEVTKEVMREGTGKEQKGQTIQVNVGGIDIGDQTLDLSNLTRREMRQLADMLAERLGDEVRNSVS